MRRYWWLYIVAALIIVSISVLTCRNEKACQKDYKQKQREQAMRDSAVVRIAVDVDTIKSDIAQLVGRVGKIEEKTDSIRTIQEKQLKNDNKQIRELRQVRRAINKCRKNIEK